MATTVRVSSSGGDLPIYEVDPGPAARRAVVVVQEAFGVNEHIEDVTRRFADAGYLSLAPHLYHRTGGPRFDYSQLDDALIHMNKLSREGILSDLEATLHRISERNIEPAHVAIVGFCMGGTVAFAAATELDLGASVSFYGGGVGAGRFGFPSLIDLAAGLRTPWLGLYGDEDHGIPVEEVEALRVAAAPAEAGVPTEIVRYPDAEHGFHCDARSAYHEPSAKDAWQRCLDWLERYVGPAGR